MKTRAWICVGLVAEKEIDGGLEVRVEGKTDEAVRVARNHAAIVSGFIRPGELHTKHPKALDQ